MGSISEGKFDTELNLARRLCVVQRPESRVSDVGVKPNEVGVIKDVEELHAELESIALFESPILGH